MVRPAHEISNCVFMKKLIGVFVILFTLLVCVIYRRVTSQPGKAKPETARRPEPLQHGLFVTALLLQ
jgi:hypothetical protein